MIVVALPASDVSTADRSASTVSARTNAQPYSDAARLKSRPCGVATCSSNASASPATGRKWKIPPPSLLSKTIVSASLSRDAASSPPMS